MGSPLSEIKSYIHLKWTQTILEIYAMEKQPAEISL